MASENDFAIIIGNKAYRHGVPEVKFAHNDMKAMARAAVDVFAIPRQNVIQIEDAGLGEFFEYFGNPRATPPGADSVIEKLLTPSTKRVIVYYSGHGVPVLTRGHPNPHLLPVRANPTAAVHSAYALADLIAGVRGAIERRAPSAEALILIDACFSGLSGDGAPLTPNTSAGPVRIDANQEPGGRVIVISAASNLDLAHWDTAKGHGVFTDAILDGLYGGADRPESGGNGDRKISLAELKRFTETRMSERLRLLHKGAGRLVTQRPIFPDRDFVIVRYADTYPVRNAEALAAEKRECDYLLRFRDRLGVVEIESFLKRCTHCACRAELEAHLKALASVPSSCEADQALWKRVNKGDLEQVRWLLSVTKCEPVRKAAQAVIDEAVARRSDIRQPLAPTPPATVIPSSPSTGDERPVWRMERVAGVYTVGDGDLDASYASNYEECAARCTSHPRCEMLELYLPKRQCNLYSYRPKLEPDPIGEAIVAIRRPAAAAATPGYRAPVAGFTIVRARPDIYFEEDSNWRKPASTFEECGNHCGNAPGCVAFELVLRPRRECILFNFLPTRRTSDDNTVAAGYVQR